MSIEDAKEWVKLLKDYINGVEIKNVNMDTVEIIEDYYLDGCNRVITDCLYNEIEKKLF